MSQARLNRLDTYNHYRVQFGMPAARSFADITHNPDVAKLLECLYETPGNVEFYPGLFAEDLFQDKSAARPWVMRSAVMPRGGFAELAKSSPLANPELQLRLINGVYPAGDIKPGLPVKTVTQ